ncbi:MAG: hypothetical protein ACTSWE_11640, partial [Promethearchaeota archaeon]
DEILVDKVFTFHAPSEDLVRAVQFKENKTYYIRMEVVTPHACNISIKINDTTQDPVYDIFYAALSGESVYGYVKEVPFVAARNGTHVVIFHVECLLNMNIYISIYRAEDLVDLSNTMAFDVLKINRTTTQHHFNLTLLTDTMYRFHFSRVSTFQENISLHIYLTFWARAPDVNDTEFLLLFNESMPQIGETISTFLGTAIKGTYEFWFELETNLVPFNFLYKVVEEREISEEISGNSTVPIDNQSVSNENNQTDDEEDDAPTKKEPPSTNDTDTPNENITILEGTIPPQIRTLFTWGTVGLISTTIIVLIYTRKKMPLDLQT